MCARTALGTPFPLTGRHSEPITYTSLSNRKSPNLPSPIPPLTPEPFGTDQPRSSGDTAQPSHTASPAASPSAPPHRCTRTAHVENPHPHPSPTPDVRRRIHVTRCQAVWHHVSRPRWHGNDPLRQRRCAPKQHSGPRYRSRRHSEPISHTSLSNRKSPGLPFPIPSAYPRAVWHRPAPQPRRHGGAVAPRPAPPHPPSAPSHRCTRTAHVENPHPHPTPTPDVRRRITSLAAKPFGTTSPDHAGTATARCASADVRPNSTRDPVSAHTPP